MTRTRVGSAVAIAFSIVTAACKSDEPRPGDNSITDNARSSRQWTQKVKLAVPAGTDIDAAAALLRQSGFACQTQFRDGKDSCFKTTGSDWTGSSSRWRVDFEVTGGRIVSFRAFYDHNEPFTGP